MGPAFRTYTIILTTCYIKIYWKTRILPVYIEHRWRIHESNFGSSRLIRTTSVFQKKNLPILLKCVSHFAKLVNHKLKSKHIIFKIKSFSILNKSKTIFWSHLIKMIKQNSYSFQELLESCIWNGFEIRLDFLDFYQQKQADCSAKIYVRVAFPYTFSWQRK